VPVSPLPRQHALVVGIDQYQYADGKNFSHLEGAVNDAQLLSTVLRAQQVQLPDERILLDAKATRSAVIHAWQDMLNQAQPEDTLIFTFSGHGGQQPDAKPLDESDNRDETLMLHDFNPNQASNEGRITDDELYGLFKEASNYNILFIADSCHSSGMVRAAIRKSGRFRSTGFWDIPLNKPPAMTLPTEGDESKRLSHVTLITAVDDDSLQVPEKTFDNKKHGALSWFFAQALSGKADGNQNRRLERDELKNFLTQKVTVYTEQQQIPKLLPRGDNKSLFTLAEVSHSSIAPLSEIAITVQNGVAPQALKHIRHVSTYQMADLLFEINNQQTDVFNNAGDKITSLPTDGEVSRWQRVIDKERLLKALETQFDMRLKPIHITLKEGNGLHKKGERLNFSIKPGDNNENLNALTLFNLAGNGELQFLYPLTEYADPLVIDHFPYRLFPPLVVAPPFGGDDLVAVLCSQPATDLHNLLEKSQPNIPNPEQVISKLHNNNNCQVGQYAFFTGK